MQLEDGKYYKTRDGRKVGPASYKSDYDHYEFEGDWSYAHSGDGTYNGRDRALDIVALWEEGPIRTVTRREIVPGVYGRVSVTAYGNVSLGPILHVDYYKLTAEELREAAHLFNQIAEVLDERD